MSLPDFKGFTMPVLDVWIRSKKDEYDRFDDKCLTYEKQADGTMKFIMVSTGTTNAGSFGLKKWRTYNSTGCAVLKADTIVYDSHEYGLHKGKPAYRQAKGFPYYRDADGDNLAEESGKIYWDIIFANCHRAGVFSSVISNFSVACLVRNQLAQFLAWLRFMNKRPLTVAILKEF